jgi:hypothetical protein
MTAYPASVLAITWHLMSDGYTITWAPDPDGCALTLDRRGPQGEHDAYRATARTMQAAWDEVRAQLGSPQDTPPPVPRAAAPRAYSGHAMTPSSRLPDATAPGEEARPPASAPVAEAERLARLHARAAVHWQIGGGSIGDGRAFYRRLLRGITEADAEVIGLFQVPDLLSGWNDYGREDLAADLRLTVGDPDLERSAAAYRAAAREEFWAEAARHARRHLGDAPDQGGRP